MGWTAATGRISIEPLALFGIVFFWQFPHFLSLAWLYKEDYKGAGLHMLPSVNDDDNVTARSMVLNSIALLLVSLVPHFLGLTGPVYLVAALFLGVGMTFLSFRFFLHHGRSEAKRVFFFSLAYIPILIAFMVLCGSTSL